MRVNTVMVSTEVKQHLDSYLSICVGLISAEQGNADKCILFTKYYL